MCEQFDDDEWYYIAYRLYNIGIYDGRIQYILIY